MDAGQLHRLAKDVQALSIAASTSPQETATLAEVAVAEAVIRHPDSSISALAALTGYSQAAVSKVVALLEAHDMAVTAKDPADGRRTLVRPTPDGRASWRARGRRDLRSELERLGFSAEDARDLDRALSTVREVLERSRGAAGER